LSGGGEEMKDHLKQGDRYAKQGQWDAAVQEYKKHAEMYPASSVIIFSAIGDIYHNQRKFDDAVKWYKKALKTKPNDEHITFALGVTYMHQGKLDDAMYEFKKVLNTKPNYTYAHCGLGQTYEKQGKPNDAMREYEKALKIDPDNNEAKISLDVLKKRLLNENSKEAGKASLPVPNKRKKTINKAASNDHPLEESQKKEKLPEGSSWMEDPEFHKMLLKRRADSKVEKRDIENLWK
jgi:tetratricopeptide (TPR) repeat protein